MGHHTGYHEATDFVNPKSKEALCQSIPFQVFILLRLLSVELCWSIDTLQCT